MIEIRNLSKKFCDKQVFENFNYVIKEGVLTAITGVSGSGKSTLLNMIGLLDIDYQGEILYDGENIASLNEKKRNEYIRNHINYLFQNYALIENETVYDNLILALAYEKITKKEKKDKIEQVLKMVDLENYSSKKIYTLSGGEQQRVALARVILKKSNIILADEPTGNLDDNNSNRVMQILKQLQKNGKTIIIVTHNKNLALECDEILTIA